MTPVITLIFSTASGILSWLIRRFQGKNAKASHCAIGTEMHGIPVVIEDTVGGVRIYPRDRWIKEHRLVEEYAFLPPNMEDGVRHTIEHVGDKYNYAGLFGYLWVMLGRWLRHKWHNPFASTRKDVCSGFILEMDPDRILVPEWKSLIASETIPEDLRQICATGASFKKIAG